MFRVKELGFLMKLLRTNDFFLFFYGTLRRSNVIFQGSKNLNYSPASVKFKYFFENYQKFMCEFLRIKLFFEDFFKD